MARVRRLLAMAGVLAAAACGPGTATQDVVTARPPVGALMDSWGWIGIRGGHVVLSYHGRRWTSAGAFHRPPEYVSSAAVEGSHIAFAVEGGGLFVASFAGAERRVGGAEDVLTWTPAGELLDADRSGHLVARSAAGALLKRWRVRAGATAVERSGEVVYLAPSGELFRTDGERSVALVDPTPVVDDPRVLTSLADGSVSVVGTGRLAIFSPSGRLTASAGTASGRMDIQGVSAAPDGRAYAYVRTIRRAKGGTDRIELLVPGDRAPRTLAAIPVSLQGCGWGSGVRWDGSRLRYQNADGRRRLVDTGL